MSPSQCPSREELLAYRCGELPEADAGRLSAHLGTCAACQETLDNFGPSEDTFAARMRQPAQPGPYDAEPERGQVVERLKALATKRLEPTADSQATPDTAPPQEDWAGRHLGEYELLAMIGRGGMGAVYKAVHTRLKRTVAVKILPKERTADERALARFNREMEAVGRLTHPNIVQAHDAREIDGTHFLVMEYVEGQDLSELLEQAGPLPIADACEIVRQAALGLQYAHDNGLIHRDIKPSNLILAAPAGAGTTGGVQPVVKILDLGLARLAEEPQSDSQMTQAGQVMGTADYIAPEQVLDCRSADASADQYSLGCTLYKLLTGHAPFSDSSKAKRPFETMMAHVQQPVPSVTASRPDVPAELVSVIERMLAKKPDQRYPNMAAAATALQPFTAGCDLGRLAASAEGRGAGVTRAVRSHASTDDFRSSAMVGTESSLQIKPQPRSEPRRFRWTPKTVALAVVPAFLLLLCGIVIWINGTRIEVPDNSEVRVTKEGTVHIDTPPAARKKTASQTPPSDPSAQEWDDVDPAAEREVAEWLLGNARLNGQPFRVKSLRGKTILRKPDQLPDEPFAVTSIDLKSPGSDEAEIRAVSQHVAKLTHLEGVVIWFNAVSGREMLRWISNVRHLESLSVRCTHGRINDEDVRDFLNRGPLKLEDWDLYGSKITDASLEKLSSLPCLEALNLSMTEVTDAGVRHLARIPNLRSVTLSGTNTTGQVLEYLSQCKLMESLTLSEIVREEELGVLKQCPNLKELGLPSIMTDTGMKHLRDLPQLRVLNVWGKKVTDAGLENLQGMTQLRELNLDGNEITDEGLRHLDAMEQLEFLRLSGTKITSAGVAHLAQKHRFVQILNLRDTQVDDDALPHLSQMKALWDIDLHGTKVTAQGLMRYNESLQKIKGSYVDAEIQAEWERLKREKQAIHP